MTHKFTVLCFSILRTLAYLLIHISVRPWIMRPRGLCEYIILWDWGHVNEGDDVLVSWNILGPDYIRNAPGNVTDDSWWSQFGSPDSKITNWGNKSYYEGTLYIEEYNLKKDYEKYTAEQQDVSFPLLWSGDVGDNDVGIPFSNVLREVRSEGSNFVFFKKKY